MHDRLQLLIKEYGLTSSRFAEILGIQPSAVSHIISGRNKPGFELLSKILVNFPDVNPRWLMLGESPVFTNETGGSQISESHSPSGLYNSGTENAATAGKPGNNLADPLLPGLYGSEPESSMGVLPDESISPDKKKKELPDMQAVGSIKGPDEPDHISVKSNPARPAGIEKIIILYTDGTFDSFDHK